MGKARKKQSRSSWRKRGAEIEDELLQARRDADREKRTGGSVSGLQDSQLFRVDTKATKPTAKPRNAKVGADPALLWSEKVVATNPHISTVTKPAIGPTKHGHASSMIAKVEARARKAASKALKQKMSRAGSAPPSAVAAAGSVTAAAPSAAGALDIRAAGARGSGTAAAPGVASTLDIWGAGAPSAAAPARGAVTRLHSDHARPANRPRRTGLAPEQSTKMAPAVPLPAPGASWNPSYEAHQELLGEAVDHEMARLRREQVHATSIYDGKISAEAMVDDTEAARLRGDDGTGFEEGEKGEESEEGEGRDPAGWHLPHEKLTLAKRNKRAAHRERQAAGKAAKLERKRQKQLDRAPALVGELKAAEARLGRQQAAEAEQKAARTKRLGKFRYEPSRPDVLLTEEQPESLRQLVPEGSLLADRFESLQARNLIEVRKKAPKVKRASRRVVNRERAKDTKYTSPHGNISTPAWL